MPIPYEGEIKNLAFELWNKEMYQQEAELLETAIKWYPDAASFYNELSHVYAKLGKPAPIDEAAFLKLIEEGKIDEAISVYEKTKKDYPGWKIFSENALNAALPIYAERRLCKCCKDFSIECKNLPEIIQCI